MEYETLIEKITKQIKNKSTILDITKEELDLEIQGYKAVLKDIKEEVRDYKLSEVEVPIELIQEFQTYKEILGFLLFFKENYKLKEVA